MITIPLCPHKMNVSSCPTCYRNKPVEQKPVPNAASGVAKGYVMPIGEATLRATQRSAVVPPPALPNGKTLQEPYRSTGMPSEKAFSTDKVWHPPKHKDLIDSQPRHPHANEGQAKVLKV